MQDASGLRYLILHGPTGRPVVTVVTEKTEDSEEIAFALSTCNPIDEFDLGHGLMIAKSRLHHERTRRTVPFERGVTRNIVAMIAEGTATNRRHYEGQRAAEHWISVNTARRQKLVQKEEAKQ
jgi:hypothetical protein